MVTSHTSMAVFLCMFIGLASMGIVSLNPAESDPNPQRQIHGKSQHESSRAKIDLQVPSSLQSSLQDDDLTSWNTAEELRIPDSLRKFLYQSDFLPPASIHRLFPSSRQPRTCE
jgi:hypothetical protein